MNRIAALTLVAIVAAACSPISKEAKKELAAPINCATAEGDIRALESEKAHTAKEIYDGVTSIVPIGMMVSMFTFKEGEKIEVATGEYNKKLDQKIAEIKSTCRI